MDYPVIGARQVRTRNPRQGHRRDLRPQCILQLRNRDHCFSSSRWVSSLWSGNHSGPRMAPERAHYILAELMVGARGQLVNGWKCSWHPRCRTTICVTTACATAMGAGTGATLARDQLQHWPSCPAGRCGACSTSGTYSISGIISVPSNCTLRGSGNLATIISDTATGGGSNTSVIELGSFTENVIKRCRNNWDGLQLDRPASQYPVHRG